MGSTNFGTQTLGFDYNQSATAQLFNGVYYNVIPSGIYSGFTLSKSSDSLVIISTGICVALDSSTSVATKVSTSTTQDLAVSSATPFIIFRFSWADAANNYMDMLAVSYTSILTTDLIVGRCIYNDAGTVLQSTFDYTRRSNVFAQKLQLQNNYFKVYQTEPASNQVTITSGVMNSAEGNIVVSGGTFPAGGFTNTINGRIDLIYLDSEGTFQVLEGVDSSSPVTPRYADRKVIAQITRGAGETTVKGNEILRVISSFDESPGTSDMLLTDSGNFYDSTNVEDAFQEIAGSNFAFSGDKTFSGSQSIVASTGKVASIITGSSGQNIQNIKKNGGTLVQYIDQNGKLYNSVGMSIIFSDIYSKYTTDNYESALNQIAGENMTFSGTKTFSNTIQGSISGNSGTTTKLATARSINGTSFDGTSSITTNNWGTSRSVSITDGTISGTATSVNGSSSVSLPLPTGITASAITAKAPINHASTSTTYGVGTSTNYGHVKLYDSVASQNTDGSPTQNAVYDALATKVSLTGNEIISGVKTFSNAIQGSVSGTATSLSGLTSTITELNYSDGVTSNIQDQLDTKLISYPTDAVVHYSFDDMSDLPDASGALYKADYGEFTATTYWSADYGAISLVNGFIVNTVTSTAHNTTFNKSVSIASKLVKIQFKTSVNASNASLFYNNGSVIPLKTLQSIKAGTIYTISVLVQPDAVNTYLTLNINGSTPGSTVTILDFYIGDGTTSQPIIDNISGKHNATGSGVVSVPGVSGKACQFVGLKGILQNWSEYATAQSWYNSFWIKGSIPTSEQIIYNFNLKDYAVCRTTGYIDFSTFNGLQYLSIQIASNLIFDGSWHHIVVSTVISSSSLCTKKIYIDTILKESATSGYDFTNMLFADGAIGSGLPITDRPLVSAIDDWQFGTREIIASEVLGLCLARGNTVKFYDVNNYNIDNTLVDASTATTATTLSGLTSTITELNYSDGVTSNLQTQINGKEPTITGAATTITSASLTPSRALISNSSGKVAVSAVTDTEVSYLDGVTSSIQTQINSKLASSSVGNGTGQVPISNDTVCTNLVAQKVQYSSTTGVQGTGTQYGVYGSSNSQGVHGAGLVGVYAEGVGTSSTGLTAVGTSLGVQGTGTGTNSIGVQGTGTEYGVQGDGTLFDFYAVGSGGNYGPFTGSHEVSIKDKIPKIGMIVSCTGNIIKRKDGISATIPECKISSIEKDKSVFGVYANKMSLPRDHWCEDKDSEYGVCNALGDGLVLVSNINGELYAGDYITTSSIPGYGQKQDDDLLHSYTLGKCTENIDWDSIDADNDGFKRYLCPCIYTSA